MCFRRISTALEARQSLVSGEELIAGWAAGMSCSTAAVATALLAAVSVRQCCRVPSGFFIVGAPEDATNALRRGFRVRFLGDELMIPFRAASLRSEDDSWSNTEKPR